MLVFKAVGEVTLDDYTQILKPALDTALAGGRRLRAVFLIGPEFTGYSSGVKREDRHWPGIPPQVGALRRRHRRQVDPRPDAALRLADGPALAPVPSGRAASGDEVGCGGVDSGPTSTQVVLATLAFLCTATHHAEPAVRSKARLSRGRAVRSIHILHILYSLHRV